jgi:hypothetical protein
MNENGSVLDTNDVSRSMAQTQWLLLYGTLDNKKGFTMDSALVFEGTIFRNTTPHLLPIEAFFFRPTPSWLPPGRPTRSIACCKLGRMVNWCKNGRLLIEWPQE